MADVWQPIILCNIVIQNELHKQGRYSPGYYKGPLANAGTSQFIWPATIGAADSGTVIYSGWDGSGYGNLIILDHGSGYWTYYAHNRELWVQAGDGVAQGQTIALSGSSGRPTGPHLGFRIRLNGAAFLDPLTLLP